ncbi:MAG: hypothetical protein ACYCWW_13530 [Deltaproteobacteria bacterium]
MTWLCAGCPGTKAGTAGQPGLTGGGPTGPTGPTGPAGSTGPMGLMGPAGEAGLPGSAGSSGTPGATGPTGARGLAGSGLSTLIDVTQSGCNPQAIPNDGLDDSAAFNCAIGKLGAGGGIVYVPAGTFDFSGAVTVPGDVSLVGTGFGSILHQLSGFNGPVVLLQRRSQLHQLQFQQDQPAPGSGWAPTQYDFQIKVTGDDVIVEDLLLYNPYQGILVSNPGGTIGRTLISDIRGQPLAVGIQIDDDEDVIHIEKIHFWPFYSNDPAVTGWTLANGIAINSLRDDNPQMDQLFFYGYSDGIHFGQSAAGITTAAKVTSFDCGPCENGILIDGPGSKGILVSGLTSGNSYPNPGGTSGVWVNADDVSVIISDSSFGRMWHNAVRVTGNGDTVMVGNSSVRGWDFAKTGYHAFELGQASSGSFFSVTNVIGGTGDTTFTTTGVTATGVTTGLSP